MHLTDLRKAREAKGLSLRELADLVDVHWSYLGHVEAGRKRPSLAVLKRLSDVLGDKRLSESLKPFVREAS